MVTTPDLVDERNPFNTDTFRNIMENKENTMFVKLTQDALGDTRESLEMFWSDPDASGMIPDDFWKI